MQTSSAPSSHAPLPLLRSVMPELDTIRGVAVLMVVLYHDLWWENGIAVGTAPLTRVLLQATQAGRFGVSLFFVLSGFLITGILWETRRRADYLPRFYLRRALRILPAYLLLLVVLATFTPASWSFLGLSALFCSNLAPLFGVALFYGPLWSLAVEEHFYLLWPLVVRQWTSRAILSIALLIVLSTPCLRAISFRAGADVPLYTWLQADGLAMGAVLALLARWPGMSRKRFLLWGLGFGVVGMAMALGGARFGILTRQVRLGAALQETVATLLFAAIIAFALVIGSGRSRRWVQRPSLRFFGEISYGLYLVHVLAYETSVAGLARVAPAMAAKDGRLVPILVRLLLGMGSAVVIAVLSRRYFEEPFIQWKHRFDAGKVPNTALRPG